MIEVGSDFSGVGAFNQALDRLCLDYETVFACDMDKYARETYIENYGEPNYYPYNVYDREIPQKPLGIYMTSPPCQSFSLAGKRKGEDSVNGVLFYNSHEFIEKNNPRFFIFENVKGLLSDNKGRTFQIWLDMLGGKSVNGNPVIFPRADATPYHIYHKVLNAKHFGVPQNRERVFIVGIRDDVDNNFTWPKPFPLVKRLKNVLETEVSEKYYLSDKMLNHLSSHPRSQDFIDDQTINVSCITSNYAKQSSDLQYLKVKSATKKGYEIAKKGDSINFSQPNSETRRGRVGKEVAQTLDTACNQGVLIGAIRGRGNNNKQQLEINNTGNSNSLTTIQKDNVVVQLNDSINLTFPESETRIGRVGKEVAQTLDTACNQGVMVSKEVRTDESKELRKLTGTNDFRGKKIEFREQDFANTITTSLTKDHLLKMDYKIRRLTPRECFRLMDFPDTFKMPCSNSQMYKQAGNSIVVNVLAQIIDKLIKPPH